jgi:cysteine-rich repeat protein
MRLGLRSGLLAAAILVWSVPVGATDIPIPGKLAIIKESRLVKFISKPVGAFTLPSSPGPDDPTSNPSSVHVFHSTGQLTDTLTGGVWQGLGNPPGSNGYKYKNILAPSGGAVKIIILKPNVIKFIAKDDNNLGGGTVFSNVGVEIETGSEKRCADFGGTNVKNDPSGYKQKDAPTPASCLVLGPTTTVTSTTSTTSTTIATVCGDGNIEGLEQCDDSNTSPGDGCDAICQIEETASQSVGAGGTVSSGTTPTAADPLETSVTTPNAGTVTIFESSPGSPPAGYEFRGQASTITAPNATTTNNPLELVFRIDASQIRAGENQNTVQVFRSGVLVPPCLGSPGTAVPEPCVGERTLLGGGDVLLRIYATHTSPWTFGYPLCGNGMLDGGETCDPPAGSCGGGDTCKADCTCAPVCDCCAGAPATLSIAHSAAGGDCGDVLNLSGGLAFNLSCNTVYFGSGLNSVPAFPFPDGNLVLKVTACDNVDEKLTIGPTTSVETGSIDTCSSAGCRFGAPAAVPVPTTTPVSTCVVPRIAQNVSGLASCGGVIDQIALPLLADVYLTGDTSTDPGQTIAGIQPCPLCSAGTCRGGPNNGMSCTAGNSGSVGAGYPTSSDCPPTATTLIGTVPAGARLTTGQVTWTATPATNDVATTAGVQSRDFVGFCRDVALPGGTGCFEGNQDPGCPLPRPPAPHQCWENGVAVGTPCTHPYETCEQRFNGAFGPNGGANRTIIQLGSAPGCLADELPHAARVVSPLVIPPTFDPTIDSAADFPGPGTISLDGNMQLQ